MDGEVVTVAANVTGEPRLTGLADVASAVVLVAFTASVVVPVWVEAELASPLEEAVMVGMSRNT